MCQSQFNRRFVCYSSFVLTKQGEYYHVKEAELIESFFDIRRSVDGLALAKSMKILNSKVNIIFLTVCDEKEHAKEVMKIKPSGYLVKPANKEQLAYELNNLRYATCAM